MINPTFYQPLKAVKLFLNGNIAHYLIRDFSVTLSDYPYTVQEEDTMYSLAYKLFGQTGTYLWTILAENNQVREPEDWLPGDQIYLPIVILNDPELTVDTYASSTSLATPIQGLD